MEFLDPAKAKTRDDCAKMFASTTATLLTYLINNIANSKDCLDKLMRIRQAFRTARGTLLTDENLLLKVGKCLLKWRAPIEAYDENFFRNVDLGEMFGIAASEGGLDKADEADKAEAAKLRVAFFSATDEKVRTVALDALNLMIIFFAKYMVLPAAK